LAALRQSRRLKADESAPASAAMFAAKGDSFQAMTMTNELIERARKRSAFADQAYVAATLALAVSVVVAFTVVSIGIARAAM
jgi:hypothetical protein